MSGEDEYKESVGQFSDLKPALNASQPVHTVTENTGDSESIARAIAERATGNADNFETRSEAISDKPRSQNVNSGSRSAGSDEREPAPNVKPSGRRDEKGPAPTREASEEVEKVAKKSKDPDRDGAKGAYSGIILFSWAALVVGGIVGVVFQLTKKKRSQA